MIKANPKAQVQLKFNELFGDKIAFEVEGFRGEKGGYMTRVIVDDDVIAEALDKDLRRSYKKLMFAVEKLYIDGIALV